MLVENRIFLQLHFSITGKSQAKNPFDFTEDSNIDASGWGGTQTTLSQMQAVKKVSILSQTEMN